MFEILLVVLLAITPGLFINYGKDLGRSEARDETIIRCNKEPKWCKDQYTFLMLKEKVEREEAKRNP
jgi:hypothetical protein